eukprot:637538-Pleurochrysis_carterae.AAC.2
MAKCKKIGEACIEAYCKKHLKQASIKDKIMTTRTSTLMTNCQRQQRKVDNMAGPLQAGRPACGSCVDGADQIAAPAPCQGYQRCVVLFPRACIPAQRSSRRREAAWEARRHRSRSVQHAPATAPKPAKKRRAPQAQLFSGAPVTPVQAAKPKTRAELMQAMCSRPPSGVGRQGSRVAASVRAQPPPPAPAP